ncbi:MAG: DUF1998 domain-containing protein, partial [Deltaproteobacteria bacterium]|nr:DUF1998 domain-containing protein [Deltaproteobacteria bacterium]
QYFMRNPSDFFRRTMEAAVVDNENAPIAKAHLVCAAAEGYLKSTDEVYDIPRMRPLLAELEREGKLRRWEKGGVWFPRTKYPHRYVSIREAGEPYLILNDAGRLIGESSASRVMYELHPGAVYLHKGGQYIVERLDTKDKKVICRSAADISYYTSAMTDEDTEIVSTEASSELSGVTINFGTLKATEDVLGYRKKQIFTGKTLGEFPLDLPSTVFTTKGVWMKVDESVLDEVRAAGQISIPGSLHALEHAAIATLPLFALCDRFDLGGVSYPLNPELLGAAIFIYDGHEGGIGLAKRGFQCAEAWFSATLKLMDECPCEVSCPSCTHDPKCGNNNDPLDKRGAIRILRKWLGRG